MNAKKERNILIIGGYGGTGKKVCYRILKETDANLIIAGRNTQKADECKEVLQKEFPNKNISTIFADTSDIESLKGAYKDANLVIDATTATTESIQNVIKASLEAKCDYLDYHYEQKTVSVIESFQKEIEESKLCFITQAGFHPGFPALFVRYASLEFDEMKKAIIGMAMNAKIEKPESVYEIVDTLGDYNVETFKNGKWEKAGSFDIKPLYLGEKYKTKMCYPLQMAEMYALPKMYPLDETGVFVAGFNWFVDYLVFPLAMILQKIKKGFGRHFIAKLLIFGLNNFSKDPEGVAFTVISEGIKDHKEKKFQLLAEHNDAYEFTGIAVAICIIQYLKGTIPPGLHMMGHIVEPTEAIKNLENMGTKIRINPLKKE